MRRLACLVPPALLLGSFAGIVEAYELDDLVTRLIEATERADQERAIARLREVTLEERHVARLVAAAVGDTSDARRNHLWQAIRHSRSRLGRQYLRKALIEQGDAASRLKYVGSHTSLDAEDVPLLAEMYRKIDEPEVRAAILELAGKRSYELSRLRRGVPREKRMEEWKASQKALDQLAQSIVTNPATEEDLIGMVSKLYARPGTNHAGRVALRAAWHGAQTDSLRIRLLEVAATRSVEMLVIGLHPKLSEEVHLAAIRGIRRGMRGDRTEYALRTLLPHLLEIRTSTPKVSREMDALLEGARRTEVDALIGEIEGLPKKFEPLEESVKEAKEGERESLERYLEMMDQSLPGHRKLFLETLAGIERRYGKFEAEKRASVLKAIEESLQKSVAILERVKKARKDPE